MKLSKPSFESVRAVAQNMRQRDADEFLAVSPFADRAALAHALEVRYGARDDAYLFLEAATPIAVGAMVQHRPNVVTLMFFATDEFPKIGASVTRFVKQRLFPEYVARGVHRIECTSIEGYVEAHRWIEALGLKREAIMPGYGRGGETFVQFAWVKENGSHDR